MGLYRLATALVLAGTAAPLAAQTASITATANVFRPITISGARNLDFANVFPGVNKSVAISAATSGGTTLKVTYSATSAAIRTIGTGATTTTFDPGSARLFSYTTSPDIYVQIGGTVQPKPGQASGSYTGTITLTVAVLL